MGCIADIQTQAAFKRYWAKRLEEDPDIDPYNDLFCDLMEENASPSQVSGEPRRLAQLDDTGHGLQSACLLSGWGDGYYPSTSAMTQRAKFAPCMRFIDIEACYKEQA